MRYKLFVGCLLVLLAGCNTQSESHSSKTKPFVSAPCDIGVYGTPESFIAITRREDNFSFSFSDGRRGKLENDTNIECGEDVIRIDGCELFQKRPIKITDTEFYSGDVKLVGQLLEPLEANSDTPLIVLAHGSEELGWIEAVSYPYQFVGRDISVFVYDKRGTGRSEGAYSQNFPELADDLVAASEEAKRLA